MRPLCGGEMREQEGPDEYLLKWREHNPQVITQVSPDLPLTSRVAHCSIFKFLEMWKEESFTDVTIATEKRIFKV